MALDVAMILKIMFLLNPISSIPVLFMAQKKEMDVKKIAFQATVLAFFVAIIFLFFGPMLFSIFSISINSFRAAGGLVITLLGASMAREQKEEEVKGQDSVISLIATPLLTGPATLSYLILTAQETSVSAVLPNLCIAFIVVGAVFNFAARLIPNINLEFLRFVSRLLGLFILAVGIEMLAQGAMGLLFP